MEVKNTVWGIKGASYDECNGGYTWICEGLLFTSEEKAWAYIRKTWKNSPYSRYEPVKIDVV